MRKILALFNALGACAAVYASIELMRVIAYYWKIVTLPYPLTYLEFFFIGIGVLWVILAVIDNLYTEADTLGLGHKGTGVFGKKKAHLKRKKERENAG